MKLTVVHTKEIDGIELRFDTELPMALATHLKQMGFTTYTNAPLKWYTKYHPAYLRYAEDLSKSFTNEKPWQEVLVYPSFKANKINITCNKSSKVIFTLESIKESYVVFESYKKIAYTIAKQFAERQFDTAVSKIEIYPRKFKTECKALFDKGRIIVLAKTTETSSSVDTVSSEIVSKVPLIIPNENELVIPFISQEIESKTLSKGDAKDALLNNNQSDTCEVSFLTPTIKSDEQKTVITRVTTHLENQDVAQKTSHDEAGISSISEYEKKQGKLSELLASVLENLKQEFESLKDETIKDAVKKMTGILIGAEGATSYDLQKELSLEAVGYYRKIDESSIPTISIQIKRLIAFFKLPSLDHVKSKDVSLKTHEEQTLDNMIIPDKVGKHFAYGSIRLSNRSLYKKEYPYLQSISDTALENIKATSLFELMQFPHPMDYGIAVSRQALLRVFEKQGEAIFKALGLPTALNYPYINLHTHHRAVRPLGEVISNNTNKKQWWHAIENYRPIKDAHLGIALIEEQIAYEEEVQETLINPNTAKPKGALKEEYQSIEWTITLLKQSRNNIVQYIESLSSSDLSQKENTKQGTTYLDEVVAIMHTHYHKGERLSKKKVEALLETTGAPTLGMLWEAVELSWLLWYRQLYLQISPFEASLKAMIRFWTNVQPTYAYSDSSKEKYKQYSTPCLIGAMLAQYTNMRQAEAVFEPSAGNGLLLVGAKPHKTVTNEIDTSRLASLKFQRFSEVHALNASEPFPEKWKHHFDVMVTNPPFARWEEDRFDKNRIVAKYFNKHYELASFMRLEHLMAGLALDTLKDTGKSGIIIMGHFVYGKDGHIMRYAPFYKWLYRHYIVDDVINLNGFTLYNKQGATPRMMLILVGGRKKTPSMTIPTRQTHPQLEAIIDSYQALWLRIKSHIDPLKKLIEQLKIANR
ncbi:hypothetical protein GCM10011344_41010 [Dokdonia pacifica]|uniref:N-6 DNA Methylase n=1 Tax=Dokdonia pacifica TaxID=1627892 RepID=A0A239AAP2_9FLAO|nr:N-6 DNA methylase [Dokdonia pacifica]GGG35905.1 hypothetical protein GCM10011344_41010 [Dokdonia pacifica]SNR92695.1 N-6 DNA Methylase [Dokdonia pacifica]